MIYLFSSTVIHQSFLECKELMWQFKPFMCRWLLPVNLFRINLSCCNSDIQEVCSKSIIIELKQGVPHSLTKTAQSVVKNAKIPDFFAFHFWKQEYHSDLLTFERIFKSRLRISMPSGRGQSGLVCSNTLPKH